MNDLLIIAVAGLGTWLLRASFIAIAGERALPEGVQQVLRHARPAVLAALVASATVGTAGLGSGLVLLPRVAGIAIAGASAWRWRNLILSLALGFAGFWVAHLALALVAP